MVLVDTGFWLALTNKRDKHHVRSKEILESLEEALITTWPVMTETCHLLLTRMGFASLEKFIESYDRRAFSVFALADHHSARILELMKKYRDLPMDLADASLVILAEEIGHGRILSTDARDFKTYRWKNRHPFQNVFLS